MVLKKAIKRKGTKKVGKNKKPVVKQVLPPKENREILLQEIEDIINEIERNIRLWDQTHDIFDQIPMLVDDFFRDYFTKTTTEWERINNLKGVFSPDPKKRFNYLIGLKTIFITLKRRITRIAPEKLIRLPINENLCSFSTIGAPSFRLIPEEVKDSIPVFIQRLAVEYDNCYASESWVSSGFLLRKVVENSLEIKYNSESKRDELFDMNTNNRKSLETIINNAVAHHWIGNTTGRKLKNQKFELDKIVHSTKYSINGDDIDEYEKPVKSLLQELFV